MSEAWPRLILSVAAAQFELETVAALMSSIGALVEASGCHEIVAVWRGFGWGREVQCACGTYVAHRDAHYDHVLDSARELLELEPAHG